MNDDEMWEAVRDCDASCDGKFFYGVKTTGIYCRPSCKSKLARRENVVFFRTREEAETAGFRPCKRCRPDLLQYDPALELSERTKELLDQHFSDRLRLGRDMKGMGVSRKHLTQVFKQKYDLTPSEYLIRVRIAAARQLLQDGSEIPDAAGMAGYENLSEFYDQFRRQTGADFERGKSCGDASNSRLREIQTGPKKRIPRITSKRRPCRLEKGGCR